MKSLSDISAYSRDSIFRNLNMQAENTPLPDAVSPYAEKHYENCAAQFVNVTHKHQVHLVQLDAIDSLVEAIAQRFIELNLSGPLRMGQNPTLLSLDWQHHHITTSTEQFSDDEQVAISTAVCGIADTGSVVLTSSNENPTNNNFLAAHHFVVLDASTLVSYSENAWTLLQKQFSPLPRTINFISGPSSSADVGLKLEYGAHGPRTLTVFLVSEKK